jgi:hypothetical protein
MSKPKQPVNQLRIVIPDQNRLRAINNLSSAIEKLADALQITPEITIRDCQFTSIDNEDGVCISTEPPSIEVHVIKKIFGDTNE